MPMSRIKLAITLLALAASTASMAQDGTWQAMTGAETLRDFMSGRTLTWAEGPRAQHRGIYRADGTGILHAWGTAFERNWEVKGNDQICVSGEPTSHCYKVEQSRHEQGLYRVTEIGTGLVTEIRESERGGVTNMTPVEGRDLDQGGPAAASADEMQAKLMNPANPIMKLGNHLDYQWYDGDLPGASNQTSFKYVFLTVFPFKLKNGNSLLVRPGMPVLFDQPVPDPSASDGYTSVGTELGDLKMDVIYSGTTETGTIWGFGVVGTIPTASDDRVGKDLWSAGPEVLFGKKAKWGVVGGVLGHQWDFAGSGDGKVNVTTLNYFYGVPLGNGWAVQAAPVISYNHKASSGNKLSLPLGIGVSKTTIIGGRPWQFMLQYWKAVDK